MKRLLGILVKYWQKLGRAVHAVISALLLCIAYFLLVTPFALLYYMFFRKKATGKETAFTAREHVYTAEDMKYMD
jgi:peptidoglycan/LPS O-acetylase OafA/YrhL